MFNCLINRIKDEVIIDWQALFGQRADGGCGEVAVEVRYTINILSQNNANSSVIRMALTL